MRNIWNGILNVYDQLGPFWFWVTLITGTIALVLWVSP
jgi:hypothetical protein